MIRYENINIYDVIDVMEALAYRILHYQYPTWHSIPEADSFKEEYCERC